MSLEDAFDEGAAPTSAERMRAEFDRSFSEPLKQAALGARDFVLVSAGGEPWALALDGLRGIEHGRTLVPVPSSRGSLLGIAGVRTLAVPVFDLAALAGGERRESKSRVIQTRAFALLDSTEGKRVGVAFERLLQFARVPAEAVLMQASLAAARPTLRHEEELYTIVEAEELLGAILSVEGSSSRVSPNGLRQVATGLKEQMDGDTHK